MIHTAIVAGTMAAKRTHELIPFCHPLGLERCDISIDPAGFDALVVECTTAVHHRTGVEMEALTGASVAALTLYDMCKSLSHGIVIESRASSKIPGARAISPRSGVMTPALRTGARRRPVAAHALGQGGPRLRRRAAARRSLRPGCAPVLRAFVSVRADQADDPLRAGYPQIMDGPNGRGPIAGIIAAQSKHPVRPGWCSPATCRSLMTPR